MWLLLATGLLGFVFFIERTLFLHQGQIKIRSFFAGIENLLRRGRLAEALTICGETSGPVAHLVKAGLLHHGGTANEIRSALQTAALIEVPILERRIGAIAAIARIAPLLGLLGTLLAALEAFLRLQGTGEYPNSFEFIQTVGTALITTVTGIVIAVMATLAHHFLHGRVRSILHDMEWVAHDLSQLLIRLPAQEAIDNETQSDAKEQG